MKKLLALCLTSLLVACSSLGGGDTSPAQAVYQAKQSYAVALSAAVAYKRLPVCTSGSIAVCSKPDILMQIQKADEAAYVLLNGAEVTVRTGGNGVALAVTAAQQAVLALTSVLKIVSSTP